MALPIFFVDPLEVVKAHHQRGDAITMLLVLRDPRASLQNKARVWGIFRRENPWGQFPVLGPAKKRKSPCFWKVILKQVNLKMVKVYQGHDF